MSYHLKANKTIGKKATCIIIIAFDIFEYTTYFSYCNQIYGAKEESMVFDWSV